MSEEVDRPPKRLNGVVRAGVWSGDLLNSRALFRIGVTLVLSLVALQVVQWGLSAVSHVLFLILLAWLLSIAIEPAVASLANRGVRRGAATFGVLFVLALITLGAAATFGGLLAAQYGSLASGLPGYVSSVVSWLNEHLHTSLSAQAVMARLPVGGAGGVGPTLSAGVFGLLGSALGLLFEGLTVIVVAYYLSADGPRLRRALGRHLPPDSQLILITVWDIATAKTGGYVLSKAVLAGFSTVAHVAFFWAIGLPYWLPLGLFAGLLSQLVPTVGTYLGVAVPAAFAAFHQPSDVLWIVGFAVAYQQLENYVITPRVGRRTMDVHPAVSLVAVLVGIALWGPIGAFLGIPIAAAVIAVIDTYAAEHELAVELLARTRGEKPAMGIEDPHAGDPGLLVPAGTPLGEVVEVLEPSLRAAVDEEQSQVAP
jgi:predicted PurR-regulated permease PerM